MASIKFITNKSNQSEPPHYFIINSCLNIDAYILFPLPPHTAYVQTCTIRMCREEGLRIHSKWIC